MPRTVALAQRRAKPKRTKHDYSATSDRAILFCDRYIIHFIGSQAAVEAGYAKRSAKQTATKLLDMPDVQARLAALITARAARTQTEQDTALKEIKLLALSDVGDAYDDAGRLLPIKDMPEHIRRCIAAIEVDELYEWVGEGEGRTRELIGYTKKVKLWDKKGSLELFGRHLKMFTDVVKVEGLEDLAAELKKQREQARQRAAQR